MHALLANLLSNVGGNLVARQVTRGLEGAKMAKSRRKAARKPRPLKVELTANYRRERFVDPDDCRKGSYRTKRVASVKHGHVLLTLCEPKRSVKVRGRRSGRLVVQSIATPRRRRRG